MMIGFFFKNFLKLEDRDRFARLMYLFDWKNDQFVLMIDLNFIELRKSHLMT